MLLETLHATHLMKLLDKMYKYEMDPTRTVGATKRTRDAGQTDGGTEWNQYTPHPHHPHPPPTTSLCGVYNNCRSVIYKDTPAPVGQGQQWTTGDRNWMLLKIKRLIPTNMNNVVRKRKKI